MNEMQGRRIPVVEGADPLSMVTQPGDYYGPSDGQVWFLLPIANPDNPKWGGSPGDGLHGACSPPWRFVEEEDGSLTIYDSIGCGPKDHYYWHGYLTRGRWQLNR